MRRGGPPAHSAATPNSWSCPARLSWTEIANIWADCLECIEPLKTRHQTRIPTAIRKYLTRRGEIRTCDWRRAAAADHLGPTQAPATSGRSLAALGRSRAPVRMPMLTTTQVIAVSRAGPGDVIMNDTISEGCGWLAGHRLSKEEEDQQPPRLSDRRTSPSDPSAAS